MTTWINMINSVQQSSFAQDPSKTHRSKTPGFHQQTFDRCEQSENKQTSSTCCAWWIIYSLGLPDFIVAITDQPTDTNESFEWINLIFHRQPLIGFVQKKYCSDNDQMGIGELQIDIKNIISYSCSSQRWLHFGPWKRGHWRQDGGMG